MPWGLKRFQQAGELYFITFSCYHRAPLLGKPQAPDTFVSALESVRRWYGFFVVGYVVMPEHVHLLLSEPERANLAVEMLKQIVSRKLSKSSGATRFWQARYYDFNVRSEYTTLTGSRFCVFSAVDSKIWPMDLRNMMISMPQGGGGWIPRARGVPKGAGGVMVGMRAFRALVASLRDAARIGTPRSFTRTKTVLAQDDNREWN